MERKVHNIDATGKIAGRLASQVAILLMGKHKINYAANTECGDIVEISNISGIKFTGNKLDSKLYYRHSQYPGNLKTTKLKDMMAKNPEKAFIQILHNMLPKNRLRPRMLKRLIIK
ncbi:MAG: 50S ribosomal protein L13 [Patescibacteria group bacterium]|jgi:large subunit ribosomal protein L13